MLNTVTQFDVFTYCVYLFFSHIVVNIMEFPETFIQVRGLTSYKISFNQPFFYIRKYLYQVRNMTFAILSFDVFELLILPFD